MPGFGITSGLVWVGAVGSGVPGGMARRGALARAEVTALSVVAAAGRSFAAARTGGRAAVGFALATALGRAIVGAVRAGGLGGGALGRVLVLGRGAGREDAPTTGRGPVP